jgi:PAS domain S-box-containing protein
VGDLLHHTQTDEPSFREVADALALGVPFRLHLSADGQIARFLHLGAGCQSMLGVRPEQVLADTQVFSDLIVSQDRERLLSDRAVTSARGGPSSAEIRIRKPSGELRWLRMTSARRPSPDNLLLDGLIVDITDARRMAEELVEERQRMEQAIELTGMGVFRWDREDPDTILWSDQQYAIYGVPPQTPITVRAVRDMVHPDDRVAGRAAMAAANNGADGADFSLEHRVIRRDGAVRWVLLHQRMRRDAEGLKAIHGTTIDITSRRDEEELRRLQIREIAHRAKNGMTVMMAMVQQAARSSSTVEELVDLIVSRLGAMARSQDLATTVDGAPLRLPQLIDEVLEAFDISRFDVDPALEAVTLPGESVLALALMLHELATNAVKYGALSRQQGRVALSLHLITEGWVAVEWRERGGPPVAAPARRGFGTRLLKTVLQGQGGVVTSVFAPDGFVARIEMPVA